MAKAEDSEFEELGNDGSTGSLQPESVDPGDHVKGEIQSILMNVGQYNKGAVVLVDGDGEVRTVRVTKSVGYSLLDEDLDPGVRIKIERSTDEESFTDDSGEEQTYNPLTVGVARSND